MDREPENVIDGTARAHQWRRSRPKTVAGAPDSGEVRSDAPKSIAGSLLVPAELLIDASAQHTQRLPDKIVAGEPGGVVTPAADASSDLRAQPNPFLLPEAATLAGSERGRRARVAHALRACLRLPVVAMDAARRWVLALHRPTGVPTSRRIRGSQLGGIRAVPLHGLSARFVRSSSINANRRPRRVHARGLLASILIAAACAVFAGAILDPGHKHAGRPTSSQQPQVASAGAVNLAALNSQATIAARVSADKAAQGTSRSNRKVRANAEAKNTARARAAGARHRLHPPPTVSVAVAPVITAAPATATELTSASPSGSSAEGSAAATRSYSPGDAGGVGATGGTGASSTLPPGPTGIGSTEGNNCNPKCS